MHEFLQTKKLIDPNLQLIATKLRQHGLIDSRAAETVKLALENCSKDPRAQWILQAHAQEQNELTLNYQEDGELKALIIDRTFIDSNNVRWIIDYKTSQVTDGLLTEFLAAEKTKHLPQLTEYAKLFAGLEDRPIKLGLYFPLCLGWVEWEFNKDLVPYE